MVAKSFKCLLPSEAKRCASRLDAYRNSRYTSKMQTFLPLPDFRASARVLDPKRLGNQAYREGLTLLRGRWPNHPAAKMWAEYRPALAQYILCCFRELAVRGRHYPRYVYECQLFLQHNGPIMRPPWLGDTRLHSSHRASLLYKDPIWYGKFGWDDPPAVLVKNKIPYFWPI